MSSSSSSRSQAEQEAGHSFSSIPNALQAANRLHTTEANPSLPIPAGPTFRGIDPALFQPPDQQLVRKHIEESIEEFLFKQSEVWTANFLAKQFKQNPEILAEAIRQNQYTAATCYARKPEMLANFLEINRDIIAKCYGDTSPSLVPVIDQNQDVVRQYFADHPAMLINLLLSNPGIRQVHRRDFDGGWILPMVLFVPEADECIIDRGTERKLPLEPELRQRIVRAAEAFTEVTRYLDNQGETEAEENRSTNNNQNQHQTQTQTSTSIATSTQPVERNHFLSRNMNQHRTPPRPSFSPITVNSVSDLQPRSQANAENDMEPESDSASNSDSTLSEADTEDYESDDDDSSDDLDGEDSSDPEEDLQPKDKTNPTTSVPDCDIPRSRQATTDPTTSPSTANLGSSQSNDNNTTMSSLSSTRSKKRKPVKRSVVPYPAPSRLLNPSHGGDTSSRWRLFEEDLAIRHMLDVRDEKEIEGERRFEEVANRLARDNGIHRSWTAIKNFWNRVGRARSGFDERKNKNNPLSTSAQGKAAREANARKKAEKLQQQQQQQQPPSAKSKGKRKREDTDSDADHINADVDYSQAQQDQPDDNDCISRSVKRRRRATTTTAPVQAAPPPPPATITTRRASNQTPPLMSGGLHLSDTLRGYDSHGNASDREVSVEVVSKDSKDKTGDSPDPDVLRAAATGLRVRRATRPA